MASLISEIDKIEIRRNFQDLHDTFKKPIIIYKSPKKEFSISTNPAYNVGSNGKTTVVNSAQSFSTFARIYYKNEQIKSLVDGGKDSPFLSMLLSQGEVEIILDSDAYLFVKDAKRMSLDGDNFYIKSDVSRSGLFSNQFYHIYLSKKE
jgi:hypothetical protein